MRPELRAQLRRQKARPRSGFAYWSDGSAITIPWTVGQRKWMLAKLKESINALMARTMSMPRPDTMIMSRDAYDAFKGALNSPD